MFTAAKDALASQAARTFVNQRIARYGEVRTLKINSRDKTIELECQLHGEREPITARIESYEVIGSGDRKVVRLGRCVCSRPWLENLLSDLARDRDIPVPSWAAAAL